MKGRVVLVNNNQQKDDQAILIYDKLDFKRKNMSSQNIYIQQCEYMHVKEIGYFNTSFSEMNRTNE